MQYDRENAKHYGVLRILISKIALAPPIIFIPLALYHTFIKIYVITVSIDDQHITNIQTNNDLVILT